MILSIRARLLVGVIGGMAVLLALFAALVYGLISRSLVGGFDAVLEAAARAIAGSVEQSETAVTADLDEREIPEFQRSGQPDYFQLWREDGSVLLRSSSLNGDNLKASGSPLAPDFRAVLLPDGRRGRAISTTFLPKMDDEATGAVRLQKVTLVVARDTAELDSRIMFLRWLMISATTGTILLSLAVGALIVRQGLTPLNTLAAQIAGIRQNEFSKRLLSDRMPVEIMPVVQTLNSLLERVEESLLRERAFTADAAHELRTPLAGIRSTLEVALARPREADDYREAISDCLDIIVRMQAMADNLLTLARLERSQATLRAETVRIAELVGTVWRSLADGVHRRGVQTEQTVPPDLECTVDRDSMTLILTNLLANAAEYASDGGWIKIAARRVGGNVELLVENSGCSLSEVDVRRVFDRLWRAGGSRADTGLHYGLGLALVKRATETLGGTVTAASVNGVFKVHLTLPADSVARG
jgi:signal transduction histidine kinase